jgi:PIN domain nuclease of toxin-antitoxin system
VNDLLLDSHAVLWALYNPALLPRRLARLLEDLSISLYISEVTLWELADKAGKMRLPLAQNSVLQLTHDIGEFGAVLVPIERADILASVVLPPHHGDPFDRLLVAQAQARDLVLVSKDRDIAKYDVSVMWK